MNGRKKEMEFGSIHFDFVADAISPFISLTSTFSLFSPQTPLRLGSAEPAVLTRI